MATNRKAKNLQGVFICIPFSQLIGKGGGSTSLSSGGSQMIRKYTAVPTAATPAAFAQRGILGTILNSAVSMNSDRLRVSVKRSLKRLPGFICPGIGHSNLPVLGTLDSR